jgi:pimeloyl-ACP methyl ester carboxylesterase
VLRKILLSIAILVGVVCLTAAAFVGPYAARVREYPAEPARGFHAPFYLYVSPGAARIAKQGKRVTILVQPNNSGRTSDDAKTHQRDAWWTGFERQRVADELNVVLLVPAFIRPATGWQVYTHALDRDVLTTKRPDLARLDLQLLAMIDAARASLESQRISSDLRVIIQGFSASGMFANRFAALHTDRVKAVAVGSPGGWPIAPLQAAGGDTLRYPAGVADLEALTGKPFDLDAWRALPQLIVMGSLDDNDSLDETDGWDADASAQVVRLFGTTPIARWPKAERLYRDAGANARFLLVAGVAHDRKVLQRYSSDFFKTVLH